MRKAPGWSVLDLYGHYRIHPRTRIDNLLDKDYAQHLNRSSAFDPTQVQVDEPGRSSWIKLIRSF